MMNQGRTVAALWRTLANRDEPAHVPGCFKMFNTTGVSRDEPGWMSNTGVNRCDAGATPGRYRLIPGTIVAPPGLYRDKPCAMKTKF